MLRSKLGNQCDWKNVGHDFSQQEWEFRSSTQWQNIKRKPYGWQVCEEGLFELWRQPYHQRPQVDGDAAGVTMSGVRPHAPVNHTFFFLCHGFYKIYVYK